MRRLLIISFIFILFHPLLTAAQPIPDKDLPPILKSWVPWVLDQLPEYDCAKINETTQCLWPGRLSLTLDEDGGRFVLELQADKSMLAPLPFSSQAWPQNVMLNGEPTPVVDSQGTPALAVEKGAHRIEGQYEWSTLPPSFSVSPLIALVSLTLDGNAIISPKRDESGLLWIKTGHAEEGGENLSARLFNKISDGIPVLVESRLQLEVSGAAREIEAESLLPPNAIMISLGGDLPVRLEKDGKLKIQVRAGTHTVIVKSRLTGNLDSIVLPGSNSDRPDVWVFEPNPLLRQVKITGGKPVDPGQTDLPEEWKGFQAFEVSGETALSLKEVRRGEPEARPDDLVLHRELWLDLGGRGLTLQDNFSGTLSGAKRLDLRQGVLGSAAVNGEPRLITSAVVDGKTWSGVELRDVDLDLMAVSRLEKTRHFPAVGWGADVSRLSATLHLPPGWTLLAAGGVDEAPQAWVKHWTLLGFFFVLILVLGFGKLAGPLWAVVSGFTFVLTYGAEGFPFGLWLFILALLALLSVLPAGRFRKITGLLTLATLLYLTILLVPFAAKEMRVAFFPQTETLVSLARPVAKTAAPPPTDYMMKEKKSEAGLAEDLSAPVPESAPAEPAETMAREDPQAVIQTGPAIPDWEWKEARLIWNGPVSRNTQLHLWLISPPVNFLIIMFRLFLLGLLVGQLLKLAWAHTRGLGKPMSLFVVLLGFVALSGPAHALSPVSKATAEIAVEPTKAHASGIPDASLLEELKNRLTRPPACAPHCVATSRVQVSVGETLIISAYVQMGDKGAWPLPGPARQWVPKSVSVDGKEEKALATLGDGYVYLRLPKGAHQVVLAGALPPVNRFTLQFASKPHQLDVSAPGWDVSGVSDDGTSAGTIELSRKVVSEETPEMVFTPWVTVTRRLNLGVSWEVVTTVERLSPTGLPLVIEVPLLAGEKFTSAEFKSQNGRAVVNLGRDQTQASWTSPLEITPTMSLEVPTESPWSETWIVACGVTWQCAAGGFPPASRSQGGELVSTFYPWPGEKLDLTMVSPKGVTGPTATIENVNLTLKPGMRLTETEMTFQVRATRAGLADVKLPKNTTLKSWSLDGEEQPVSLAEGKLPVSFEAGEHDVTLNWQSASGLKNLLWVPTVDFGMPLHNIHLRVEMPSNRWLLFTGGPNWGPAVLFWAYLLLIMVVAFFLGRRLDGPLPLWKWFFLGLGLTQIPAAEAVVIALWFFILRWRERSPPASALAHNLVQVGVVIWSFLSVFFIYNAVHHGLLFAPDMQIMGNESTPTLLHWTLDRSNSATSLAWVLSLNLWFWRGLMLLWSLWLAISLIGWLSWGWSCFNVGGMWRKLPRSVVRSEPPK